MINNNLLKQVLIFEENSSFYSAEECQMIRKELLMLCTEKIKKITHNSNNIR